MNKYQISFSLFPIKNNKISPKNHFSNCRTTIEGNTFDEAVVEFKKKMREEGWAVGFLVEGEIANITFFDL